MLLTFFSLYAVLLWMSWDIITINMPHEVITFVRTRSCSPRLVLQRVALPELAREPHQLVRAQELPAQALRL
jgi:hypothetical protein